MAVNLGGGNRLPDIHEASDLLQVPEHISRLVADALSGAS